MLTLALWRVHVTQIMLIHVTYGLGVTKMTKVDHFDRNELDIYLEYPVAWYREGHAAWSFIIVESQINMHL